MDSGLQKQTARYGNVI